MSQSEPSPLSAALTERFGTTPEAVSVDIPNVWNTLATRGSVRDFKPEPVAPELIAHLAALALCAPTKSDLQQRDIIHVTATDLRSRIAALIGDQPWTTKVPELLIFCGNNRRQRIVHQLSGHPFANDHLDAFFNAAVDAGIALSAFVIAAESVGLGCCPISAVRNHPDDISDMLQLPQHVFPVAGLAIGWPVVRATITPRLPLAATVHENAYDDTGLCETIAAYDARRNNLKPYVTQRNTARFGTDDTYGWSQDKARQYAEPERTNFGSYIRNQGFNLD